jgi:hypothetical protein
MNNDKLHIQQRTLNTTICFVFILSNKPVPKIDPITNPPYTADPIIPN